MTASVKYLDDWVLGSSLSITPDFGVQGVNWNPGDRAYFFWGVHTSAPGGGFAAAPAGWTKMTLLTQVSASTGDLMLQGYFKNLLDGEDTTPTFTRTGPGTMSGGGVAVVVTGQDPTTPEDSPVTYAQTTTSTTAGVSPSVDTVSIDALVLRIVQHSTNATNGFAWISSEADGTGILGTRIAGGSETSGSDQGIALYEHVKTPTGPAGTGLVNAVNSKPWNYITLAIRSQPTSSSVDQNNLFAGLSAASPWHFVVTTGSVEYIHPSGILVAAANGTGDLWAYKNGAWVLIGTCTFTTPPPPVTQTLTLDAPTYEPGETATFTISNPFQTPVGAFVNGHPVQIQGGTPFGGSFVVPPTEVLLNDFNDTPWFAPIDVIVTFATQAAVVASMEIAGPSDANASGDSTWWHEGLVGPHPGTVAGVLLVREGAISSVDWSTMAVGVVETGYGELWTYDDSWSRENDVQWSAGNVPGIITDIPDQPYYVGEAIVPIDLTDYFSNADTYSADQFISGVSLVGSVISGTPTAALQTISTTVLAENEDGVTRSEFAWLSRTRGKINAPASLTIEVPDAADTVSNSDPRITNWLATVSAVDDNGTTPLSPVLNNWELTGSLGIGSYPVEFTVTTTNGFLLIETRSVVIAATVARADVNDAARKAVGGGNINDGLRDYYLDNGATGGTLADLEYQWLAAQGYTEGTIFDRWMAMTTDLGYQGTVGDRQRQFWIAQLPGYL